MGLKQENRDIGKVGKNVSIDSDIFNWLNTERLKHGKKFSPVMNEKLRLQFNRERGKK